MVVYTSIAVFLFSAIALVVPTGFSAGAVLLLAGSVVLLRRRGGPALQREEVALISVLVFYFLVASLSNAVHGAPLREYDSPLRFLLVIPVLFLLRVFPPIPRFFWGGVAVGAISSGLFAAWQIFSAGGTRADGFTNPIQFGNICMLLAVSCIAGIGWAASQRRAVFWSTLLSGGIALGLLGAFITGSRGSWISLPVVLLVAYRCYGGALDRRHLAVGLGAMLVLVAVLDTVPRLSMEARVQDAVKETRDYFVSGDATTSVGIRLEMWRTALVLVPEHAWLGWGKDGYIKQTESLVAAGKARAGLQVHTHLHNEYLDALVKRGLPGLAALLALYLVPLVLFARRVRDENHAVRPYALAGVLLIVNYMCFGLTQAFLTHNNGVMLLGFMLVILWSLLRAQEDSVPASHRGLRTDTTTDCDRMLQKTI